MTASAQLQHLRAPILVGPSKKENGELCQISIKPKISDKVIQMFRDLQDKEFDPKSVTKPYIFGSDEFWHMDDSTRSIDYWNGLLSKEVM
jgi:hypothetical protein